jgi:hypothetical protein
METPSPEPAQTYLQLRDRILSLNPEELQLTPSISAPHVWGVLVETGYEIGAATLVSFADGTTSLYYSTGGGLLGSSDYTPLAEASKILVSEAERHLQHMSKSKEEISLPSVGQVSFIVLTFSGAFSAQAPEEQLASGSHSLSLLYTKARTTMEQLHILSDKKRK